MGKMSSFLCNVDIDGKYLAIVVTGSLYFSSNSFIKPLSLPLYFSSNRSKVANFEGALEENKSHSFSRSDWELDSTIFAWLGAGGCCFDASTSDPVVGGYLLSSTCAEKFPYDIAVDFGMVCDCAFKANENGEHGTGRESKVSPTVSSSPMSECSSSSLASSLSYSSSLSLFSALKIRSTFLSCKSFPSKNAFRTHAIPLLDSIFSSTLIVCNVLCWATIFAKNSAPRS